MIASKSSTTARVSRKILSAEGNPGRRRKHRQARTRCRWQSGSPSLAAPRRRCRGQHTATYTMAGPAIPPSAASTGTAACRAFAKSPGDDLMLELDSDDEEEDREQPIGRPRPRASAAGAGPPGRPRSCATPRMSPPPRSWPRSSQQSWLRAAEPPDSLLSEDLSNPSRLARRPSTEDESRPRLAGYAQDSLHRRRLPVRELIRVAPRGGS